MVLPLFVLLVQLVGVLYFLAIALTKAGADEDKADTSIPLGEFRAHRFSRSRIGVLELTRLLICRRFWRPRQRTRAQIGSSVPEGRSNREWSRVVCDDATRPNCS